MEDCFHDVTGNCGCFEIGDCHRDVTTTVDASSVFSQCHNVDGLGECFRDVTTTAGLSESQVEVTA